MAFAGEQVMDAPVAETPPLVGELDDARAQLDGRASAIGGSR